jgi:long-chain fatty acid transport protein
LRTRDAIARFTASVLTLLVCAQAHASGPELFGFGPHASALAGSGASVVDGYDSVYANPAGLARLKHRRLTLGYYYGQLHLDLSGNAPAHADDVNATVLGGEIPMPFTGPLANRIGLGFGFYTPVGLITRAHVPDAGQQIFVILQDRPQVVAFQVGAGVRIGDWPGLSLDAGASVLALAALVGDIQIQADAAGRISARSEQQLVTDYAPILGATAHIELGDLSAVYHWPSSAGYDVTITNNLVDQLPVGLPVLRLHGYAQYDPAIATLEMGWHSVPKVKVITGVSWKRWSDYCCDAANGGIGLAVPPSKKSSRIAYPNFSDTYAGHLGFERVVTPHLQLRLGYAYEPSPVHNTTVVVTTYLDNDRHVFAGGLAWAMSPWRIEAFSQVHLLTRDTRSGGSIFLGGLTLAVDLQ